MKYSYSLYQQVDNALHITLGIMMFIFIVSLLSISLAGAVLSAAAIILHIVFFAINAFFYRVLD